MINLLSSSIGFLTPFVPRRAPVINMLEPYDLVGLTERNTPQLSYNQFMESLNSVDVAAIIEDKNVAILHDNMDNTVLYKYISQNAGDVIGNLVKNHIDYQVFDLSGQGGIPFFVQFIGMVILLNAVSFFIQKNSPGGKAMQFMKKNEEVDMNVNITTTFDDVSGIPEAKEELYEIVDFLRNPVKYNSAGAKVPRGVLLEGDPGTGKTLLARAVAGEANVNFISASGSQFVEMFVGVGAQRVRSLFEAAKENAPCVVFIDEIDAIGGKRGSGFNSGGNDEREQTLNQILTCMDGFEKTDDIIVLAATNRIDTLDSALLRAGRFDRKIRVTLPDYEDRKEIARVHFRNKNTNFDYDKLAELTTGFSGADIENLANEAAILSVREGKTFIDDELILKSFEKSTIGLPKKRDTRSLEVRRLIATHEAGHAIVVQEFPEYFNLRSVTMNANTGGAGGYTLFTPTEFYAGYPTKGYYMARMMVALGGRAAEMLSWDYDISGPDVENKHVTTGASNDLMQATSIANDYIDMFESYVVSDTYSQEWQYKREIRIKQLIDSCLEHAIAILKKEHIELVILRNQLLHNNTVSY